MPEHDEVLGRWSRTAPFWDQHREILRELFGPVSEALIKEAEVVPGCAVLDVATGSGEPALRVAEVVGPAGTVAGVDPAAGMIEAARRVAAQRSHSNLRFGVAGADSLPFPNDSFDAVLCRFGVMFFPSPIDGVREMLRVLKPGKKVALAVWHYRDSNPFHCSLARIVDRFAPEPSLPPDAPDAFRFALPGKLRDIVAEAGARDVAERLFRFSITAPLSGEEFWNLRCDMSDKLRQRLAALSGEVLKELKHQALGAFRIYETATGVSSPAEVLIVSARK